MTRIEIELYADRLSRHAERLRDDLEGARMRLSWLRLESVARDELGARDTAVLEALGVLSGTDEAAERRLVDRRSGSRPWSSASWRARGPEGSDGVWLQPDPYG
jgi:hypothetical protein